MSTPAATLPPINESTENVVVEAAPDATVDETAAAAAEARAGAPQPTPAPNLTQVPVDSPNTAFNLMISFLGLAQRRGAFGLQEASKIFECVEMFRQKD